LIGLGSFRFHRHWLALICRGEIALTFFRLRPFTFKFLQLVYVLHQIRTAKVLRHGLRVVVRAVILHSEQILSLRSSSLLLYFFVLTVEHFC
jgi:hypothetical protein